MSVDPRLQPQEIGTPSDQDAEFGAGADLNVHKLQDMLAHAFAADSERPSPPASLTDFEACLGPVLQTLGWHGDNRRLLEAYPHADQINDLATFRAVLLRLGFDSVSVRLSAQQLTAHTLPAIVERAEGPVVLLRREPDGTLLSFCAKDRNQAFEVPSDKRERMVVVSQMEDPATPGATGSWFLRAAYFFRRELLALGLVALICSMLGLATPLFTANVYNHVIGVRSLDTLAAFVIAIAAIVGAEIWLRHIKGGLVAHIGARFHAAMACAAFERILSLPISRIEQVPVSTQLQRFRQFEGLRAFFTGNLANAMLELPFALVFLFVIASYGLVFALIPVSLTLGYALIAVAMLPVARDNLEGASNAHSRLQAMTAESLSRLETIHQLGAMRVFSERHQHMCHEATRHRFRRVVFDAVLQTLAQSMMTVAGIAALGYGAVQVISGQVSLGGLIAVMMLIWRLLAPIQLAFLGFKQITHFLETVRQLDTLMRMPRERVGSRRLQVRRAFDGNLQFEGVAFRYPGRVEPALRSVTLAIPAGQVVAITGPAGSGKSTLLKLVLRLYTPLAGAVFLDGFHLQQVDLDQLRCNIGYCPQTPEFFFGTLEQNLRLADPTASPSAIQDALSNAGLANLGASFRRGLQTRLLTEGPEAIAPGAIARVALARAYLRRSSLLLLDDPGAHLDQAGDAALIRTLGNLRGRSTVLIVTNRPAHMLACERLVVLDRGLVTADGTPAEVLARLKSHHSSVLANQTLGAATALSPARGN